MSLWQLSFRFSKPEHSFPAVECPGVVTSGPGRNSEAHDLAETEGSQSVKGPRDLRR